MYNGILCNQHVRLGLPAFLDARGKTMPSAAKIHSLFDAVSKEFDTLEGQTQEMGMRITAEEAASRHATVRKSVD